MMVIHLVCGFAMGAWARRAAKLSEKDCADAFARQVKKMFCDGGEGKAKWQEPLAFRRFDWGCPGSNFVGGGYTFASLRERYPLDRRVLGRPEWALGAGEQGEGKGKGKGSHLLYFCGEFANYETPLGAHSAMDSGAETADRVFNDVTPS